MPTQNEFTRIIHGDIKTSIRFGSEQDESDRWEDGEIFQNRLQRIEMSLIEVHIIIYREQFMSE
jgi:hypothetical protein